MNLPDISLNSKASDSLRFGLVGAGTHGRGAIVPAFLRTQHCKLLAVADSVPANLNAVDGPRLRRYPSLHQMLENEDLDAVYIATLPETHCELALMALEKRLHVVCEKPLAADADEGRRMVDAAKAADRRLVVMFENRFKEHYIRIREWLDAGHIGEVEAMHLQSFGRHPAAQPRRTNLLNASGCLDSGIHMLDLVRYWSNGSRWHDIHARGTWFGEAVKNPPHLAMMARLDNGTLVTFEDSFSYGYGLKSAAWNFARNSLTIVGRRGVIVDGEVGGYRSFELVSDERRESIMVVDTSHSEEIPLVLDQMAREIFGAPPCGALASGEDGLAAQEAVDRINYQCRENASLGSSLALS